MNNAFISIGSNIGDRYQYLKDAVQALHIHQGISVISVSSIYETAPVGYTDQADFLNLVVQIEVSQSAGELLAICQEIEQASGRVREVRWGPRTVDLDILLFNQDHIETEHLIVPHPRMHERAFVLIPLLEIAPLVSNPLTGKEYAGEAAVQEVGVEVWKSSNEIEWNLSS